MTEVFDYWARTHRHAPRDATSRGIASAMKLTLLVALTALALPGLSRAGGFYVGDFGTPSMGTAGAGANARADDASAAFHGPAGMTRLDEHQLMLGAAPGFATVKFDPDAGTPTPGTNGGQQGGFIPILSSHYVHKLSDRWRFGVSLVSISGSVLDPSDDWVGRNEIVEVSLFTLTLVPSLAYRVNDWLSLGAGVGISYGRLNFDVRAPGPLGLEIEIDDADDFAVTGVVSALVELSPELRVGIVYQSETEFDLSGGVNLPAGVSAGIDLELPLAQTVRLGIYWDATDRLALLASGAWEDWSTAENLPVSVGAGSANVPLGFEDTWKVGVGLHYRLSDPWLLQAGFSYDTSALKNSDRTTAFPIDRQLRYAIGVQYDWSEFTRIGLSFVWIDLGNARVNTGFVKGEYEKNDVFLFGVNVNWKQLPWSGRGTF